MRKLRVAMLIFTLFFEHPTQAHKLTSKLDSPSQAIKDGTVKDNAAIAESSSAKYFQLFSDIDERKDTDFSPQLNFRNLSKVDIEPINSHKEFIEKGIVEKEESASIKFKIPEQPLTSPLPARPGTKVITSEWLLNLPQQSLDSPIIRWLNNTHLLYDSAPLENKRERTIELLNVHTGEYRILGKGSAPSPSPDGQWIAFTQGEKESKQLWIMDHNGSNLKQLSHIKGGLSDYSFEFAWSPDSKRIALVHQPSFPYWEKKDPPQSRIDVIDVTSGHSQHIASFDASIRSLSWLPNGKELLFMKERVSRLYNEDEDREWIQSLRIQDAHLFTLAKFGGLQQSLRPVSSPDGQWIAFMYDADNPQFNFMPSLGLIPNDSSNSDTLPSMTRLTHELKLYSPRWSHDGQRIYVLRDYGAYKQIYAIDAKTGEPSQITQDPLNIESYALSPDGTQLAWMGQDAHATHFIRVALSDGRNVRDLAVISTVPNDMALSEVREIDWQAPPDYPVRLRGLLFMPLNYQVGTRYPLIVDIHGGGAGASI